MIKVEIDEGSGFCFGVVTAIHKAEEELAKGETLYCLGDIVHNSREDGINHHQSGRIQAIEKCKSIAPGAWRATGNLYDCP